MSHKRIKTKAHRTRNSDEFNEVVPRARQSDDVFLTPILNTALMRLMKDSRVPEADRVHLCMIRYAFGNWSDKAIHRQGMESEVEVPDDLREFDESCLGKLLIADAPCPWCGKNAGKQHLLPKAFRWHRHCLILAYARDAEKVGNETDRQWAAKTKAELGAAGHDIS